ncbi:hypothetical protein N7540_011666 [Penicillium herquei]|nr:hypothetical protein N7540_011666 [Penicillium herquei]
MKRRITYIQRPDAPFEVQQAVLTSNSLTIHNLEAAREDRLTFDLDDLPDELRNVLQQSQDLRLRWATERPFDAIEPFASRETFIAPPPQATHAGAATSLQYHTELPSLKSFVDYIEQVFCDRIKDRSNECSGTAESLLTADTVDLDYDSNSNTLVLSGLWSTAPDGGWSEEIKAPSSKSDKVEFGLLGAERGISADEIKIGGLLASHNLAGLRTHSGETDLEAPDWAVNRWGSTWLFELATPVENEFTTERSDWTATIPLHLRYLKPSESGYRSAHVPWPVVFWACSAEDREVGMGINPFDRTNIGYDELFGPRTFFYQLHPDADRLVETLDIPVFHLKEGEGYFQTRNIELVTTVVISLGFFWILWRLLRVAWSSGVGVNNTTHKTDARHKNE